MRTQSVINKRRHGFPDAQETADWIGQGIEGELKSTSNPITTLALQAALELLKPDANVTVVWLKAFKATLQHDRWSRMLQTFGCHLRARLQAQRVLAANINIYVGIS